MDRLEDIKNGSFTAGDVMWLVQEVSSLRAERDAALKTLIGDDGWPQTSDLNTAARYMAHQRRGALTELAEVHDILAEALGYEKAHSLEEDPNCPCPGDYVTGEHTAASLAAGAAKKLALVNQRLKDNRIAQVNYEQAITNAVDQIVELQQQWNSLKQAKKAELRGEIAALRRVCSCSYWPESDELMPSSNCPTHGVEACDRKCAGEKALNTLAYVRKYFMGSEHGHEV